MEEPTDEMLNAIMEKVAEEARESNARAEATLNMMMAETMALIQQNNQQAQQKWMPVAHFFAHKVEILM